MTSDDCLCLAVIDDETIDRLATECWRYWREVPLRTREVVVALEQLDRDLQQAAFRALKSKAPLWEEAKGLFPPRPSLDERINRRSELFCGIGTQVNWPQWPRETPNRHQRRRFARAFRGRAAVAWDQATLGDTTGAVLTLTEQVSLGCALALLNAGTMCSTCKAPIGTSDTSPRHQLCVESADAEIDLTMIGGVIGRVVIPSVMRYFCGDCYQKAVDVDLEVDENGYLVSSDGLSAVKRSIAQRLMTNPGEWKHGDA